MKLYIEQAVFYLLVKIDIFIGQHRYIYLSEIDLFIDFTEELEL